MVEKVIAEEGCQQNLDKWVWNSDCWLSVRSWNLSAYVRANLARSWYIYVPKLQQRWIIDSTSTFGGWRENASNIKKKFKVYVRAVKDLSSLPLVLATRKTVLLVYLHSADRRKIHLWRGISDDYRLILQKDITRMPIHLFNSLPGISTTLDSLKTN